MDAVSCRKIAPQDEEAAGDQQAGLPSRLATGSLQNLTYQYDAKGNLTSLTDGRSSNEILTYRYDHLDRLQTVSGPYSQSYSYDALGRFASPYYKPGTVYSYPGAGQLHPHAPSTVGGSTFEYDANGNLTGQVGEDRRYDYDLENRLVTLRVRSSAAQLKAFQYGGDGGLRVLKDAAGNGIRRYVSPEYQVDRGTGEGVLYYRFGGRAVAWAKGNDRRYLLGDPLSSVRAEVSTAGTELAQRRAFPFGTDRPVTGANYLARDERFSRRK